MNENQERADFEAWAKQYGRIFLATKPKFGRGGVMYENQFTQEAWVGWQARAALAAQGVPAVLSEWERSVLEHAATAIEMGPRAGLVMNVDGVVSNLRRLAATPAPPQAQQADMTNIESPFNACQHREHCKGWKMAVQAQQAGEVHPYCLRGKAQADALDTLDEARGIGASSKRSAE